MSSIPSSSFDHDLRPTPGGVRRFIIALVVTAMVLVGVVVGVWYWMSATSRGAYTGPEKIVAPEHRPFR